ncbi:MAG: acetoacetate decarboxylase family protein [Actinomycetota bacterium]|nr:acetoacetate decarboxylase family protein [Actinomycetota bacterium]
MNPVLARVPGVPETALSAADLGQLDDSVAAAPWRASARAVFWWRRLDGDGRAAAARSLPPELSGLHVRAAAGAMVSYSDTPVGPYHEVIGLIVARRGLRLVVHVPFIAVDSRPSVVGGRANWALPKTLATFTGEPSSGVQCDASAGSWRISATPITSGPAIGFAAPAMASVVQVGADRELWTSFSTARGRARRARVQANVSGASFADWFPTGACSGTVVSFTGRFRAAKRTRT